MVDSGADLSCRDGRCQTHQELDKEEERVPKLWILVLRSCRNLL